MLLNLQLEPNEAKMYAQYVEDCRKLASKMRGEAEAYGHITPEKIDDSKIKMPYPVFYENKTILPYLDLTQKDKVIGIKVRHIVLYKNSLKSHFREIKHKCNDLSTHFGFLLDCPSDLDLAVLCEERRNINATATLLRQYGIDFRDVEGLYWYRNSPTDKKAKAFDMSTGENVVTISADITARTRLRPIIIAERADIKD